MTQYANQVLAIWKNGTLKDVDSASSSRVDIGEYVFVRLHCDPYIVLVFRHGRFSHLDSSNAINELLDAYRDLEKGAGIPCLVCK